MSPGTSVQRRPGGDVAVVRRRRRPNARGPTPRRPSGCAARGRHRRRRRPRPAGPPGWRRRSGGP
ncbi:hypothetical protein E9529_14825 [Blastococcus sp. KM273128]|nr:hypothetical protein [Blastococcus sp. KM273128]